MKAFIHLLLVSAFWCGPNPAPAQTWTLTGAATNSWRAVASSADGTKLVAVTDVTQTNPVPTGTGAIYVSTDSGITWTQTSAPGNNWSSVASSADGTKLLALASPASFASGTGPYTSTDSGATWTLHGSTNGLNGLAWGSAASSADGTILAALAAPFLGSASLFTSTNSGSSWVSNSITQASVNAIACSADGTKMVVTSDWGIYTSTNSGGSWSSWNVTNYVPAGWSAVASSADGAKLVAIKNSLICISTNSGMTWTQTSAPATNWTEVASSADGSRLAAIAGGSSDRGGFSVSGCPIYTSADSGTTWTSNSLPVQYRNGIVSTSVASSADGNRLLAVLNSAPNGAVGIWMLQTIPAPSINIALTNGSVALSWIVPSTNFVMQQNADLQNWTDVTNQPVLNLTNLQDEVILPPPGSNVFYRLKTP
jgi:hypothetical protein